MFQLEAMFTFQHRMDRRGSLCRCYVGHCAGLCADAFYNRNPPGRSHAAPGPQWDGDLRRALRPDAETAAVVCDCAPAPPGRRTVPHRVANQRLTEFPPVPDTGGMERALRPNAGYRAVRCRLGYEPGFH